MPTVEEVDLSSSRASARDGSKKQDDNSLKVLTTDEIKNRKPSLKRSSNWSHLNSKQSNFRNSKITEESFKSDSSFNEDVINRHPIQIDRLNDSGQHSGLGIHNPKSNLRRSKTVRVDKNLQVIPMSSEYSDQSNKLPVLKTFMRKITPNMKNKLGIPSIPTPAMSSVNVS